MRTLRRLWPYLKPCRARFLEACVVMACVAGFTGFTLKLLQRVVDEALFLKNPQWLPWAAAAVPAVFLVKLVLVYTQSYLTSWIGQKATQLLREDLYRHLHDLSMDFFWRSRSGEVLSRVTNDLNTLQSGLQFIPLYAIRDTLTLAVLAGVLLHTNWRFALAALAGGPVAAAVLVTLGRKMRAAGLRSQEIMAEIYHRFLESLEGMTVIKAFNYEEPAARRFRLENEAYTGQMMRYLRATALSGPLMEFLGSVILAGLVYLGGREIIAGRMSPGDFFAFLAAFFAAYDPLKNLAHLNPSLQMSVAAVGRIFQIMDERPSVPEAPDAKPFKPPRESILFKGVSYRYPGSQQWALQGVHLAIRPGETVALVGPSGSGKSTLALLLLRFFDPVEGAILVDGTDLREFSVRSLRERIGLVTQETILFNDPLRANLSLGRPASEEALARALRAADAESFVRQLPQGLDTPVGDRGARLSGGQRQRIAIARALLGDPPLMVLDEATASLDSASEAEVQKAIEGLARGRTTLVIAHRLSTVSGADRIVVLDRGAVAETGTHAELRNRGGLYASLYELQQLAGV